MIRDLLVDYEKRLRWREDADRRESEKQAQKRSPVPESSNPASGKEEMPKPDGTSLKRPAGADNSGSERSAKAPKRAQSVSRKKPPAESAPEKKETAKRSSSGTPSARQREKSQKPASVARKRSAPSESESGGDPRRKKSRPKSPGSPLPQVAKKPRRVTRQRGRYMFNPMNVAETRELLAPDGLSAMDKKSQARIVEIAERNNGGAKVPIRVLIDLYESPPRDKHGLVIKAEPEEETGEASSPVGGKKVAAGPKKVGEARGKKTARPRKAPSSADAESEDDEERQWTSADEDCDSSSACGDSAYGGSSQDSGETQPWGPGKKHDDDSSMSSRSKNASEPPSSPPNAEESGAEPEEGGEDEEGGNTPEAEVVEEAPEGETEERPGREEVAVEDASDEETGKAEDRGEVIDLGDSPDDGSDEEPEEEDIVVEASAADVEPARLRGNGPPDGWTSDQSVLDTGDEMHEDEAPSDAEDTPQGVHKLLTKAAIRAINREELLMVGLPIAEEIPKEPSLDVAEVCVAVKATSVGQACYAYRLVAGQPLNDEEVVYAKDPSVRARAEEAFQHTRIGRGIFSESELRAQGVDVAQCEDLKDGVYRIRGGGRSKKRGGRPRKIDDSIVREMKALQKDGEYLVTRTAIRRCVKDALKATITERGLLGRWVVQYEAHTAIQDALENFATELFQDAVLGTIHAKRRTTQLEDMKLAGQLTGLAKRPDRDAYKPHPDPKVEKKRIVWKSGKT
jgi:histone H3/H4